MSAGKRITITLHHDAVERRWWISGGQAGPAGTAELWLTEDVELVVDAVDTERLVELGGDLTDGSRPALPEATGRLIAALLGREVAARLADLVGQGQSEATVPCQPTAGFQALGRLALLEHLRATGDLPSPWWAAEAAFLANQVDHPGFIKHAAGQARQAAPLLAALTRIPDRWFGELSEPISHRLLQLARAVAELLPTPASADGEGTLRAQRRAVSQLARRLEILPGLAPEEATAVEYRAWARIRSARRTATADDLPDRSVLLPDRWWQQPGHDRTSVAVPLRTFRDQVAPEAFQWFMPDATVEVSWSPSPAVQVAVPVRPGAEPEELSDLYVRVFSADSDELLSAAELTPTGDELSVRVELPRSFMAAAGRPARVRLKVDLTSYPRIAPPSGDLRRRRRAVRTGATAAAAARLGDRRTAEQGWRSCARQWEALGEPHQARRAAMLAAECARTELSPQPPTDDWFAGECLPVLLDAWANERLSVAEQVRATDPSAAMQLARLVIEVLSPSAPRLPLAAARVLLARLLATTGSGTSAHRQLEAGRRIYGQLNHHRGLDDCARLLATLPPEAEDDPEARRYLVGVSILRDELIGVLIDDRGIALDVQRQQLDAMAPTEVAAEVAELVRRLQRAGRELDPEVEARTSGLGVDLGGPVNHESGEVVFYSPYQRDPTEGLISDDQTWKKVPFARLLTKATGIQSVVENDANALAAYQLAVAGSGGARYFAVLLVGDGIGCGLVLEGKLYRGARGAAGEMGHIVVPGGRKCSSCEREGCLDSLAAVRAILANIGRLKEQPPIPDLETATSLLKRGDKEAWEAFDVGGNALAHATADVLNVLSPSRVILRAPASMLEPDNPFIQAFKTLSKDRFLQIPDEPELVLEPLRLADGAHGSALLARERFLGREGEVGGDPAERGE
jgi:predicted NBD/HSP70 family sugar kinase